MNLFCEGLTVTNTSSKKANTFLLTENRDLKFVFSKIRQLDQLNRHVAVHLDPPIRDYCQAANVIGGKLILIVANGSIATQIRYQTTDLIKKFALDPALHDIRDIHCKVRPAPTSTASRPVYRKSKRMEPISSETSTIINDIAEGIEDPKLREIMQRIAKRTKK